MSIGFRASARRNRVEDAWIEKFRTLPVANISDVMSRGVGANLRPMHGDGQGLAVASCELTD